MGRHRYKRRPWTEDEKQILLDLYGDISAADLSIEMKRSPGSIHQAAKKLGLTKEICIRADLIKLIQELHPHGYSDSEIAARYREASGRTCERHAVADNRRALGLPSNAHSEHLRDQVRKKTQAQLKAAGLKNLAELRSVTLQKRVNESGWPTDLPYRCTQILTALWKNGAMTRLELAKAIGMKTTVCQKKLLCGSVPRGNYLSYLLSRGLVVRLGRCVRTGSGKGQRVFAYMLSLNVDRQSPALSS